LTESEGATAEAAAWRAEAAAEATEMVESAAEATEMVQPAAQQNPERPRLSARPC
jgi:hypothetical protein